MKTELLTLSPVEFCRETMACVEGYEFATQYQTMRAVWDACPRVDWLCWILKRIDAPQSEEVAGWAAAWSVQAEELRCRLANPFAKEIKA